MNRDDVFAWVRAQYGTEPDYPWLDSNAVLRHAGSKKWYGIILEVSGKRLGLAEDSPVDVLNIKCDPVLIGSLRTQPGFFPAYHMSKTSWISILLDGPVPDSELTDLLDLSFRMTMPKPKKSK